MRGLTVFITNRTALEPAEPIGLNISQDELSFYSLLYWPIDPKAAIPDAATMARIDSFMKQGGSVFVRHPRSGFGRFWRNLLITSRAHSAINPDQSRHTAT